MKAHAIPWLLAVALAPAAHAMDFNWSNHEGHETAVRTIRPNVSFMDDARYIVSPVQTRDNAIQATFQMTKGSINNLQLSFWSDQYGPDQWLASFNPGETFTYNHIDGRIKYYFLVTGSTGPTPGGASYTLTSDLVPKTSALMQSASAGSAAAVPEPSEYAMFALGVALLPLARRLRRRQAGAATAAQPALAA